MKKFKAKIFDCSGTINAAYHKKIPTLLCEQMIEEYVNRYKEDGDLMLGIINTRPNQDQMPFDISYDIKDISHRIDNLYVFDNSLYAIGTLLDTPNGRLVQDIGIKHFAIQPTFHSITESGQYKKIVLKRLDLVEKPRRMWKEATMTEIEQ